MRLSQVCVGLLAAVVLAAPCSAATYTVRPDGAGDFPDISSAVAAAVGGDVILLADGTFTGSGNRNVECREAIEIRSLSDDPAACVIDCQGNPYGTRRAFWFRAVPAPGVIVRGLTIANGRSTWGGGGVIADGGSVMTFANCVFRDNRDDSGHGGGCNGGGAVSYCGSTGTFIDCLFEHNQATGGGALDASGASVVFEGCEFRENVASESGGACYLDTDIAAHFIECLFVGNTGQDGGALFGLFGASVTLERCTMVSNAGTRHGSAVMMVVEAGATAENTILAFNSGAEAVWCQEGGQATSACSDIYGNEGGDWVAGVEGQLGVNGNIWADPLFCDREGGDFGLNGESPCGPEANPDCGLIGALPVGCGGSPVQETTWGALKRLFGGKLQ